MLKLRQKTIHADGVTITVRERIGADVWTRPFIEARLRLVDNELQQFLARQFVDYLIQTVSIEGLDFEWPTLESSDEELLAAFDAWQHIPPDLMTQWANILFEINTNGIVPESDTGPES
ncbi:MAG: hypothetical protein CUN54_08405 [Phototrophicales bacterium]|nr:MAG: hypothetical protein CUN54_08405 [Phototrophicales bacterium]